MKKLIIAALLAGSFGFCHVAHAQDDSLAQAQAAMAKFQADLAANPGVAALWNSATGVPDVAPAGDMAASDLPKCSDSITTIFIKGALAAMPQPLSVLSVASMDSGNSVSAREVCVAVLITNAGVQRWDFQYFGSNGTTYVQGVPDSDQTNLDVN